MLRLALGFIFHLICYFGSSSGHGVATRITQGQVVNILDYPFQLQLDVKKADEWHRTCGASIIGPTWALTAAHCVDRVATRNIRLRSGSDLTLTGGNLHSVEKYVVHPSFSPLVVDYDVAAIQIMEPFVYKDEVQPIKLSQNTPTVDSPVFVSGFGYTNSDEDISRYLRAAELVILDHQTCESFYPQLGAEMLCAGDAHDGKGFCSEDSGGPLSYRGEQLGIASRPGDCSTSPGVYTDVAHVREWITSVTGIK